MSPKPLKNLTVIDLAPIWSRLDIPTEVVARALGVSRQGLSYKAKSLGLPNRFKNRRKYSSDDAFKRMWKAGVNTREMANAFGYGGRQAITTRRRHLGPPSRTRGQGGTNHGGWIETITLAEFQEAELARLMKLDAEKGMAA